MAKHSIIMSFKYALTGIKKLFQYERNAQIHLFVFIVLVIMGVVFKISSLEWIAILICSGSVFCAEALNTAIEELTDLVEPNHNPKAGAVKDLAAGAVLLLVIASIIVGGIIFLPKFIALLK